MSRTISSFLTNVLFGTEAGMGTETSSYAFLWDSEESDSLTFGEEPIDIKVLRGARGQLSSGFRECQNLPGGALGAAPIALGTADAKFLSILYAHFQSVGTSGIASPYTYTFTPTTGLDDDAWFTLSVLKDTGVDSQAHLYTGCIVDELEIAWESGQPIMFTPTFKAMESSNAGTMPESLPTPAAGGYLQAPNISVQWNGSEIYPASFSISSLNNTPDKQSGDAKGRKGFVVGDYSGNIELSVWRNENSDADWVSPFYNNSLGTVVITATMDTSYGTIGGAAVTMTYTAYCRVEAPNDLTVNTGDLVDTVTLRVMADTSLPVLTLTQNVDSLLG